MSTLPDALGALRQAVLDSNTANLIADFGQPHWPFWRWLMALLLLAQIAVLAQQAAGADFEQLRPRPANRRPPIVRVQRPARPCAQGRGGTRAGAARRAVS